MSDYEAKAVITTIKATSRASVSVKMKNGTTNFYTVEYGEERAIPDVEDVDIEAEKRILWNAVNTEVDNQVEEILKTFG